MADVGGARVLKAHVDAAKEALFGRVYPTTDAAALAVAQAVIEAQGPTRWVVIAKHGSEVLSYGPYASAETAHKAIDSGLMVGTQAMVLAMQPVPRKGHR